jgi:hypothetical protein
MGVRDEVRAAGTDAPSVRPLKVFINHRHSEAAGHAKALFLELAPRFGRENVFLDSESLQPGEPWLKRLRNESGGCGVLLALIGPTWEETLKAREREPEEDHVRSEIETALRRGSGVEVIPVVLDDAPVPRLTRLASLRPLLGRQLSALRLARWDDDVEALVSVLERIRDDGRRDPSPPPPLPSPEPPWRQSHEHLDDLVRYMLEDGTVVPVLGPGVNSSDRTERWRDVGCGELPDAEELAAFLAAGLKVEATSGDLAEVSQLRVVVDKGDSDLNRILRMTFTPQCPPSSVHRFLASMPEIFERLGYPDRYAMILTTNYDDALERAFDEAEEPYDLALYLHKQDLFLHIPHVGEPEVIKSPNTYDRFPIDAYGEAERTVIVKIHGGINPRRRQDPEDNYVITENDYIDYLSRSRVNEIVPQQILGKLKDAHFLFLGYTMREWSLRVFLQRIFGKERLNRSWAVQREPFRIDSQFWESANVEPLEVPLTDYLTELTRYLEAAVPAHVE